MSRHLLVDRPDRQVVIGFDRMLVSFFGQVFDPSSRRTEGMAIAGWPTSSGLGMRRPALTESEAKGDIAQLIGWANSSQPEAVWQRPSATAHLEALRIILLREWDDGADLPSPAVPASLKGPL